ncbi:hypothetical protein Tco_0833241 [Tanacetum coccineum]
MPVELGSFDVIIGMDWMTKYHVVIVCDEKLVRISLSEILTIQSDRSDDLPKRMTLEKSTGRATEECTIVRDFPEAFPEDSPGLPLTRQVKFQIELVPGDALVAQSPYRQAPSEMQ